MFQMLEALSNRVNLPKVRCNITKGKFSHKLVVVSKRENVADVNLCCQTRNMPQRLVELSNSKMIKM